MRRLGESLSYRYFRGNFRLKQRLLFLTHFKTICLVGTVKLWAIKILTQNLNRPRYNHFEAYAICTILADIISSAEVSKLLRGTSHFSIWS